MLRNREGFTLIELLIVVVIIGILAAVAIPKFSQTRERAYVSAMQSDLRNLQSAQEIYYASSGDYEYMNSGSSSDGEPIEGLDFVASQGVTVTLGANGDASEGWQATATHAASNVRCEVYVGAVVSDAIPGGPGVVACNDGQGGGAGGGN